jgi:serine/threonine protein kinase
MILSWDYLFLLRFTEASDIYGVGVCAYYLLAHMPPFLGLTASDIKGIFYWCFLFDKIQVRF